ncbi:MAG: hypothetical protein JXQ86_04110 [Methylophilaceae bacterium]
MAQQQLKKSQPTYDDEIDLFELLHFIVRNSRFWIAGGIGFGLLGLVYALILMPLTGTLLLKNDIGLTQQTLALTQAKLPGLIKPLSDLNSNDRVLNNLSDPEWLIKNIKGISGLDTSKLKNLDLLDEKKMAIDSVKVSHKSANAEQLNEEILRIADTFRSGQQYISLVNFINQKTQQFQQRQVEIRNTLEENQLKMERLTVQIKNYQVIAERYPGSANQQLVIELKNQVGEDQTRSESMNRVEDLAQSKYLPITSRLTALETQLSDLQSARVQFERELQAITLGLTRLNELNGQIPAFTLTAIDMQALLTFKPMSSNDNELTREARVLLSEIDKQLTLIGLQSTRLSQQVPLFLQQQGKLKLIVIAGVFGGVLGFLFGAGLELVNAYRRRYH